MCAFFWNLFDIFLYQGFPDLCKYDRQILHRVEPVFISTTLLQRIASQHEIASREMAAETQRHAVARGHRLRAVGGAGDLIPEPALAIGAVVRGLDHHCPALKFSFGIIHFLHGSGASGMGRIPSLQRSVELRVQEYSHRPSDFRVRAAWRVLAWFLCRKDFVRPSLQVTEQGVPGNRDDCVWYESITYSSARVWRWKSSGLLTFLIDHWK